MWESGIETWDVSMKINFQMSVALLWTNGDFLAYGMLLGYSTHGKLVFSISLEYTKAFRLQYSGNFFWLKTTILQK